MIADMMLFAKPPAIERTETTVQEFMTPIVEWIQQELPAGVRFNVEINCPGKKVSIDIDQIAVAVHAICNNSLEAMAGAGELTVRVDGDSDLVDTAAWLLEIRDTGPGISDAVRRHLFVFSNAYMEIIWFSFHHGRNPFGSRYIGFRSSLYF